MWSLASIAAGQGLAGHHNILRDKKIIPGGGKTPAKNVTSATKDQLKNLRKQYDKDKKEWKNKKRVQPRGFLEGIGSSIGYGEEYDRRFGGTNNWLDFYRDENQRRLHDPDLGSLLPLPREGGPKRPPIHGDPGPWIGPPIHKDPGPRPIRGQIPERDWLADFYNQYNIGGRGGNLDQEARDYWSKEAEAKGQDAIKRIIFNTAKAEGTLGGAFGNPEWGMIKDTWIGPRGKKHYSFENTDKQIVQNKGGRRRKNSGKHKVPRAFLGSAIASILHGQR